MMRIITGKARGVRLETLEGENTRPTAEKVKEAVFSAIQFDLQGRAVLDLFAGSGQMALEAMSRGAARAMFIDSSPEAMDIIKKNAKKTGFFDCSRFLISDFRNYLRKAAGKDKYDLIFIDPPYSARCAADAVERIFAHSLANDGCIIVVESEEDNPLGDKAELLSRFEIIKQKRYGRAFVTILVYKEDTQ